MEGRIKNWYFEIKIKGMYYLRSRPAADAIKFTLEVENLLKEQETVQENIENEKY